jgi:hypothetical protein
MPNTSFSSIVPHTPLFCVCIQFDGEKRGRHHRSTCYLFLYTWTTYLDNESSIVEAPETLQRMRR